MNDIIVTKSLQALKAFNTEFRSLLPNLDCAIFYIKRNNNVIPFRGFAFKAEDNSMRVQVKLDDGRLVYMNVEESDEVYFTTNVLYLSDFQNNADNNNMTYSVLYPKPSLLPIN